MDKEIVSLVRIAEEIPTTFRKLYSAIRSGQIKVFRKSGGRRPFYVDEKKLEELREFFSIKEKTVKWRANIYSYGHSFQVSFHAQNKIVEQQMEKFDDVALFILIQEKLLRKGEFKNSIREGH